MGLQRLEEKRLKQVSFLNNDASKFLDSKRPFFVGTAVKSNQNVIKNLPFPANSG
jgi:hypothetical protein